MEKVFRKPEGSQPNLKFISFSKLAKEDVIGTVLEGTYVGTIEGKNFEGEPQDDFKFELDDGTIVIINRVGAMAREMDNIKVGDYVQVNYLGKHKATKGKLKGKELHRIEVLVA